MVPEVLGSLPLISHGGDDDNNNASFTQHKMDSEQLLTCPYNESHQIRRSRFPYHLVKCRKNHPKVANDIRVCPFNARHQIRKAEYKHHLLHCEDGKLAAEGGAQGAESKYSFDSVNFAQQASARETLPSGENWDDEEEDSSHPFVFGQSKFVNGKKV